MKIFLTAVTAFLFASRCVVQAATPRGVFAHFMVGNTANFTAERWFDNMDIAAKAGIHGFVLNMAADWSGNEAALELAFPAAISRGFKLFFSFDYAGGGPWKQDIVISYMKKWGSNSAYWLHDGKPLVSTFEGPENAADWKTIKAQTNCFFIPDWSSSGAGPALALAGGGIADGLFSWAAWPYGTRKTDTYTDVSYKLALSGKPYIMAVSPWFFTNLPGYDKNWLWRGGNLWYERWQQVWSVQPDYVEIISWNDFGESHYIGPLDESQYEAFTVGKAPFNYVKDVDHTGWLLHLPFMIQTYMTGNAAFQKESAVLAHPLTSTQSCTGGTTTGNTASQLQLEFAPGEVAPDRLYVAALLTEPTSFYVVTDGGSRVAEVSAKGWDIAPDGGIGLYYTSIPISSPTRYKVQFQRGGLLKEISTVVEQECHSGMANYNARVTASEWTNGFAQKSWTPQLSLSKRGCTQGWGEGNFNGVCAFTCKYNYCPDACVCENMGIIKDTPKPTYEAGFPANGDPSYGGLCDFACNLGYCPSEACSKSKQPVNIPVTSPFLPPTCTGGTGSGDYKELCEYGCKYGFCPRNRCQCTSTGVLNLPPTITNSSISWKVFEKLNDADLCHFGCIRGKCPSVCQKEMGGFPGGVFAPTDPSPGSSSDLAYDSDDFSWVTSFAAIGDSFAAGIGVGEVRPESDAKDCSRYTGGYPLKMQKIIQAPNFQYVACSGDTSKDIVKTQFRKLQPDRLTGKKEFDLISVSAGGNDVGFSDVLKSCLFLPSSDYVCTKALADAETKIDNNLALQISSLLNALDAYMTHSGALVWTLYAEYFDLSPSPCNSQQWCLTAGVPCLSPTVSMRQEFNRLVTKANQVLLDTFAQFNDGRSYKKVFPAHWGPNIAATGGQFCESDSADNYDDFTNSKLAFIRPSLNVPPLSWKRDAILDDTAFNLTVVPAWKRDTSGIIPDAVLRNFHPNELGTIYQASTALGVVSDAWDEYNKISDELGDPSSCPISNPDPAPAPEPSPETPPPEYQSGICSLHLYEWDDCNDEKEDLSCKMTIYDHAKKEIGSVDTTSCNADNPMRAMSKLPQAVIVSAQHRGDYVQFSYGDLAWKSGDKACKTGAWDPKLDYCISNGTGKRRQRQMDCTFRC